MNSASKRITSFARWRLPLSLVRDSATASVPPGDGGFWSFTWRVLNLRPLPRLLGRNQLLPFGFSAETSPTVFYSIVSASTAPTLLKKNMERAGHRANEMTEEVHYDKAPNSNQ
jgi:hypothetical protein